jgi:hypothetical protein
VGAGETAVLAAVEATVKYHPSFTNNLTQPATPARTVAGG